MKVTGGDIWVGSINGGQWASIAYVKDHLHAFSETATGHEDCPSHLYGIYSTHSQQLFIHWPGRNRRFGNTRFRLELGGAKLHCFRHLSPTLRFLEWFIPVWHWQVIEIGITEEPRMPIYRVGVALGYFLTQLLRVIIAAAWELFKNLQRIDASAQFYYHIRRGILQPDIDAKGF
jgi:hypothetical protein